MPEHRMTATCGQATPTTLTNRLIDLGKKLSEISGHVDTIETRLGVREPTPSQPEATAPVSTIQDAIRCLDGVAADILVSVLRITENL